MGTEHPFGDFGAYVSVKLAPFKAYLRRRGYDDDAILWKIGIIGTFSVAATGFFVWYYISQNAPFQLDLTQLFFQRLGMLLLGAVAGFIVGAFFSPLLKPFRAFLWAALGIVIVLYGLFGDYGRADMLDYVLAGVAFLISLVIALRLGAKRYLTSASPRRRPTSFGSAQWATYPYLQEKKIFGREGLLLGEFIAAADAPAEPLQYKGVRHLLTVAPTRSGKGVSSIIPNLLTYPGSVLVVDPKGENALITAHGRGKGNIDLRITGLGQKIVLLDPWDIASSRLDIPRSGFNPLDWIKAGDPDAAENAFLLADALVVSDTAKGEDRFWDEEAKAVLTGVILYVATAPDESANRTLGRVRDIVCLDDARLRNMLEKMYKHPDPVVRSTASRTALKEDKLLSSVMASVQSHTHFLDSPRIRESLSRIDFSFEDMKQTPTSIYLILPADRLQTFGRWLRLLIQQAITVNARNIEYKPVKPILFVLDEMPSLGRLPSLEQAYSLMAGFGMQLWGICQDLSQLARVYGENGWQTFISNSGVIQYFGSRDKMTAEYFSTLCGVTTIEVRNFSWAVGKVVGFATSFTSSFGLGGGSSSSSSSSNTSDSWTRTTGINESQRKLAYPDELMVMRDDQQVIFVENLDPIPAKKIVWYEDAMFKAQGVNLAGRLPDRNTIPVQTPVMEPEVVQAEAAASTTQTKPRTRRRVEPTAPSKGHAPNESERKTTRPL